MPEGLYVFGAAFQLMQCKCRKGVSEMRSDWCTLARSYIDNTSIERQKSTGLSILEMSPYIQRNSLDQIAGCFELRAY
jgi:hypothetical protein